jgi:hypothetical protein
MLCLQLKLTGYEENFFQRCLNDLKLPFDLIVNLIFIDLLTIFYVVISSFSSNLSKIEKSIFLFTCIAFPKFINQFFERNNCFTLRVNVAIIDLKPSEKVNFNQNFCW